MAPAEVMEASERFSAGSTGEQVTDLGNIKGSTVSDFVAWFARAHGEARLRAAVERLSAEDSAWFIDEGTVRVTPSTWYPARPIHHLLDELTRGMSPAELDELSDRGGQETMRSMTRGAHAIVFALFLSPKRYGYFMPRIWRLIYDTGSAEHRDLGANRSETFVRDWKSHHPLLCRMNFAAKLRMFRVIGCKNVIIERRYCVDAGDPACGSLIRWDDG